MNTKPDKALAEKLLQINAITLQPDNPFVWASGWNSPIYTDNRKALSYPDLRSFIKVELCRHILEDFPECQVVAGVATGAIAMGAIVADTLALPYVYVRSTPKDHGMENLIEGNLKPGSKVVVIEDLVSTGGSHTRRRLRSHRHARQFQLRVPHQRQAFPRCRRAHDSPLHILRYARRCPGCSLHPPRRYGNASGMAPRPR